MTQENKQPNNGDICLIRYAKLGNYKGELQVSNAFDSSLVLLNPDIKEGQALKNMQPKHDKVLIQEKRQKWSQFPFKTIQEMKCTDKDGKLFHSHVLSQHVISISPLLFIAYINC
ncbi:hypothetical protein DY000_02016436 [Brassica cretica]|uniref:Uncharacterized protein n=1 Tax=Brassica cretica TaxID=69181 RepID=A0ABQ7CU32_BRACR|nr:hypothetical protein DY000_02016436 [Brassica cretica]